MKLSSIYKFILAEQSEEIVKFSTDNFFIFIRYQGKKMKFSPIDINVPPKNIMQYLKILQERFLVLKINEYGNNIFEVIFDPREDFNAAIEFVKNEAEDENGGQGT